MSLFDQRPAGQQVPQPGAARREDRSRQRGPPPQRGGGVGHGQANLNQITDLTARLTLTVAREQAEMAAAVISTWELPVAAGIATSALGAGRAYNDDAQALHQRAKNGEDVDLGSLGSPHVRVWTETCAYLGKTLGEGAELTMITAHYRDVIMKQENEQLADIIPVFRVRRNKGKDGGGGQEKCRFQFKFGADGHQIQTILTNQLKKEGAVRKLGSAPRGALERELGRLVNT